MRTNLENWRDEGRRTRREADLWALKNPLPPNLHEWIICGIGGALIAAATMLCAYIFSPGPLPMIAPYMIGVLGAQLLLGPRGGATALIAYLGFVAWLLPQALQMEANLLLGTSPWDVIAWVLVVAFVPQNPKPRRWIVAGWRRYLDRQSVFRRAAVVIERCRQVSARRPLHLLDP